MWGWVQSTSRRAVALHSVSFQSGQDLIEANMSQDPPVDKPMKYVSPAWRVMADGYLLDLKPHLHDGGIQYDALVNGKNVGSSQAEYGGTDGGFSPCGTKVSFYRTQSRMVLTVMETITAYSKCHDAVKIRRNDNLTMEVWYDLTKHNVLIRAETSQLLI